MKFGSISAVSLSESRLSNVCGEAFMAVLIHGLTVSISIMLAKVIITEISAIGRQQTTSFLAVAPVGSVMVSL